MVLSDRYVRGEMLGSRSLAIIALQCNDDRGLGSPPSAPPYVIGRYHTRLMGTTSSSPCARYIRTYAHEFFRSPGVLVGWGWIFSTRSTHYKYAQPEKNTRRKAPPTYLALVSLFHSFCLFACRYRPFYGLVGRCNGREKHASRNRAQSFLVL